MIILWMRKSRKTGNNFVQRRMMKQADNKTAIAFLDTFLVAASIIAFMGAAVASISGNYDRAIYLILVAIWLRQSYRP